MAIAEISTREQMLDEPAPAPCIELTVRELVEWLYSPQYVNGRLDDRCADHMEAAGALIERLLGVANQ